MFFKYSHHLQDLHCFLIVQDPISGANDSFCLQVFGIFTLFTLFTVFFDSTG